MSLKCNMNINTLAEKELDNTTGKLRFYFYLLLFYLVFYVSICIYLDIDRVNNIEQVVFSSCSLIFIIECIAIKLHRLYSKCKIITYGKEVDKFNCLEATEELIMCILYDKADDINISVGKDKYIITYRRLGSTVCGIIFEVPFSKITGMNYSNPNEGYLEIDGLKIIHYSI